MSTRKNKIQQYFFLLGTTPAKINRLESEILFYLMREDRRVFNKSQELSRWIEALDTHCKTLSLIHRRCIPAAVVKSDDHNDLIHYSITPKLKITIYKSNIN